MFQISASQSDSDQSDYVPNKSPILSREEQEQKDFELAMQLSQEEDSNVDGGQNLSILLNAKPSAAFADDISMNNSIEEESPPKQSSNQKIQQLPCSSSSATNNFKSGSNFENDDYVDFSDDENFTQNSLSSLPKSHPTVSENLKTIAFFTSIYLIVHEIFLKKQTMIHNIFFYFLLVHFASKWKT